MYYSYKSSSKRQSKIDLSKPLQQQQKVKQNNSLQNEKPGRSIMNIDLTIGLSEVSPSQYQTNLQHAQCDFQRINEARKLAQDKLKQARLGSNFELTQSAEIEHQDCNKLMNFIIGGYVDNDFNEYLSIKKFNKKKDEFKVLNIIYQDKQKQWKKSNTKNVNYTEQVQKSLKQRSLLSMINLNHNSKKMTRVKIEKLMKTNKLVL